MRLPQTPIRLDGRAFPGRLRAVVLAGMAATSIALVACSEDSTPTPAVTPSTTATATTTATPSTTGTPSTTATETATGTETPTASETASAVPTGPAEIAASDQTTDGTTLVIDNLVLPADGFVAIHVDDNGAPGAVVAVSELIGSGDVGQIEISLDKPLTDSGTYYPMAHIDGDGDGAYTFPGPDGPATTAGGDVAVVGISVTVAEGTPAADAAAIEAEDQISDGTAIIVASVTLPNGGFVAVHGDDNGAPGAVIGVSPLLPPGLSEDVEVTLDEPLTADATVYPMAHIDDGNGTYEFPGPDGPAVDANGDVAVVAVVVTVQAESGDDVASMDISDQTGDGTTVMIDSVTLPDGGFVAIHADDNGAPGAVIGVSELLPPGTSEDVEVTLDMPLTADGTIFPMAHVDGDGNGTYEFPGPDGPATDADGAVVVAPMNYAVQA